MKTYILSIILLGASVGVFAQSNSVAKFKAKYENDRDASVVHLSDGLFKLLSAFASLDANDEEAAAIARISENIRSMDIVAVPYEKVGMSLSDFNQLRSDIKKEKYEELMEVKDGNDHVYFLSQGNDSEVANMVVLVKNDDKFVVMNIDGTLQMKDVAYLVKHSDQYTH